MRAYVCLAVCFPTDDCLSPQWNRGLMWAVEREVENGSEDSYISNNTGSDADDVALPVFQDLKQSVSMPLVNWVPGTYS